jgi:hypothetical protein
MLLALFNLEEEGTTIIPNVSSHSPNETESYARRPESLALLFLLECWCQNCADVVDTIKRHEYVQLTLVAS